VLDAAALAALHLRQRFTQAPQRLGLLRAFRDHRVAGQAALQRLGQLKNNEVTRYRDPVETELMQRLKRALDPDGILNPGKVLPD
jgi:hypothetical protein